MHPLLYHSLLFSPPWGSHAMQDRYFHQRQYPLIVIISEWENSSLTYARHVRNLQAPFVDAFRQCTAPIRMVSPLRMQPPHFHRCQSSCAWFSELFRTKTQGSLNVAIIRDSSVIWKKCVCAHVGLRLCVLWSDMMKTKRWGKIILMMCHQCRVGGVIVFALLLCVKEACVYVRIHA